jgi:hypothetical protein
LVCVLVVVYARVCARWVLCVDVHIISKLSWQSEYSVSTRADDLWMCTVH